MDERVASSSNGAEVMQGVSKIGLVLVLAAACFTSQPAYAQNETRVGLMFEIPFGGSQGGSFVHFANTRIGAKVQYAQVDDIIKQNEQVTDRVYQDGVLQSSTTAPVSTVTLKNGDKVSGGEAYFLVTPFNSKWNMSGGINGFTGSNNFQGALGIGYDLIFGAYGQLGALMPCSELGVRFNFKSIDFFAGMTSLPGFSPKTVWKDDAVVFHDTFNTTPAEDTGGDTGSGSGDEGRLLKKR